MKKFYFLLLVFITLLSIQVRAQQDPIYTQYLFNPFTYNPAYAGSYDMMNVNAISRVQWLSPDFGGSNKIKSFAFTNNFSAHTTFPNSDGMGAGLMVNTDRIGPVTTTAVNIAYSYKIKINEYTKLSMGLQGGLSQYTFDYANGSLNYKVYNDPNFPDSKFSTKMTPNFGAGLYLLNDQRYYFGVSVPHILSSSLKGSNGDSTIGVGRYSKHYYVSGGVIFGAGGNLPVRPSFLLRMVDGAPAALDLSTSVLLSQILWAGVSLRSTGIAPKKFNTVGLIGQLNITDYVRAGFSYDVPISNIIFKSLGTYEFCVNINFAAFGNQTVVQRYF